MPRKPLPFGLVTTPVIRPSLAVLVDWLGRERKRLASDLIIVTGLAGAVARRPNGSLARTSEPCCGTTALGKSPRVLLAGYKVTGLSARTGCKLEPDTITVRESPRCRTSPYHSGRYCAGAPAQDRYRTWYLPGRSPLSRNRPSLRVTAVLAPAGP